MAAHASIGAPDPGLSLWRSYLVQSMQNKQRVVRTSEWLLHLDVCFKLHIAHYPADLLARLPRFAVRETELVLPLRSLAGVLVSCSAM